MHFWVAVRKTYSNGDRVLGKFSGRVEGWISRFDRPIWARSCFRRGEADARTTRLDLSSLRMGRSRGRGGRSWGGSFDDAAGFWGTELEGS